MIFPVNLYGYPKAEGYTYSTDLALLQTSVASGYTRQRRTYMHNASLYKLTFKVSTVQSMNLRKWLQQNNDWFVVQLLSGNDASQVRDVYEVEVRRTSTIETNRVAMLDQFMVSFEVETRSTTGYQTAANDAANLPVQDYPANLPMPSMRSFTTSHGDRNVTKYSLVYRMDTETLKLWQLFAGYIGTYWFRTFMISPNVYGTNEVLRYISSPTMTLVEPNIWEVAITADTLPELLVNFEDTLIPIGDCAYNSPIDYDFPLEEYDCAGQIGPPTGSFTMPVGGYTMNVSSAGFAPQTTVANIKFGKDGTITSSPVGSPAWTNWHTDPYALPAAAIAFDTVLEVSNNGTTWNTYTPAPSGQPKFINLQVNDVYVRRKITTNVDVTEVFTFTVMFESDKQTDQYTTAGTTITINSTIDVTVPVNTVIPNFKLSDTFYGIADPDGTNPPWRVGLTVNPDGTTASVNGGGSDGNWANPIAANTGTGKWIIATKTGGNDVLPNSDIRISMATPIAYHLPYNTSNELNWIGNLKIYDAEIGGTLLGSGTLILDGYMEPREPDIPPGGEIP
jgi:hypothetical protein